MAAQPIFIEAFVSGFRPEPDLLVSEWADKYRIIAKPSPEPGMWRTDRVPYARQIMDDLAPSSPVEIVVLRKAAQGAGTEVLLNAVGCWMDLYPDSILVVTPTTKTLRKFSRTRIDRMIEATPRLSGKVAPHKSRTRSNTIELKEFGSDHLILTGANSAAGLRSDPIRYLAMDEIDAYPFDIDGEGEPVELALERTAAYRNRKVFLVSTPTLENSSRIEAWFHRGDQNFYHVPCPACGHMQSLVWQKKDGQPGGLKWPAGSPELARYECEACEERFEEWQKIDPLGRGAWIPDARGNSRGLVRSYSINALYYPYGWPGNAWPNLAEDWERNHRDPVRLKTFINLKLGEPWKDATDAKADPDVLMGRRHAYGPTIPAGAAILTAGVDVQANRLAVELVAWGRDEESWSMDYRELLGDTARQEVWKELSDWLAGEWRSELGPSLSIRTTCIDAGYTTEMVKRFCVERRARRIWAVIGRANEQAVWPSKLRKQKGRYPPLIVVGVDKAKEVIYQRLRIPEPGPGYCHFSTNHDRQYFEMLTAEQRIPDYTRPVPTFRWEKKSKGARNEALDCRNLAYAGLLSLSVTTGFRLNEEVMRLHELAVKESDPHPVQPKPQSKKDNWLGDRGRDWFAR